MTQQIDNREGALRQHRSLALLCALKCLRYGWDAIVVDRGEFETILGLERIRPEREEWIQQDFSECFPFQGHRIRFGTGGKPEFSAIAFGLRSKKDGPGDLVRVGKLNFQADPRRFREELQQSCLSPLTHAHLNGSELAIASLLTMLSHGQIGIADLFGGNEESSNECPNLVDMRIKYADERLARR